MTVQLPIINGSTGVWGNILNASITDIDNRLITATDKNTTQDTDITDLKNRVKALEQKPATLGMLNVCTSTTRPSPVIGQIVLETDTGYLYYVANISGAATRVPWPGQSVAWLRQTTSQNLGTTPGTVGTNITWNSTDFDRLGGANGTSRYTIPLKGVYEFTGAVSFAANATGFRSLYWSINGTAFNATRIVQEPVATAVPTIVTTRTNVFNLTAGTYVELTASQSSTVTLATDVSNSTYQPGVQIKYLGYYGS